MRFSKKQLLVLITVGAICFSAIKYYENGDINQPVDSALNSLKSINISRDLSLKMADTTNESSEISLKIDSINYDKSSFVINESVNLSLTLSETEHKDNDRNYYIEVYSCRSFGEYLLTSSNVTIKKDSEKLKKSFKISFDTPGDVYTLIKIYDKKGGTLLLDKKSADRKTVEYILNSDKKLNGIDTVTSLNSSSCKKLKNKDISFVVRYYSENEAKNLSKKEAENINDSGMQIVIVYQDCNNKESNFTYNNGVADCKVAIEKAIALGQPSTTPIYFAVDFDVNDSNINTIYDYFDGINKTMDEFRNSDSDGRFWKIGGYGSYYVVKSLKESDRISYVWQTFGWSYNKFYSYNMYQKTHDVKIAGIRTDENVSNPKKDNNVGGFFIK